MIVVICIYHQWRLRLDRFFRINLGNWHRHDDFSILLMVVSFVNALLATATTRIFHQLASDWNYNSHVPYIILMFLFVDISLKHQLFSNYISSQCTLPVSCHRRRGVARYPSPSTRQGSRSLFGWSLATCTQFPGQMWPRFLSFMVDYTLEIEHGTRKWWYFL